MLKNFPEIILVADLFPKFDRSSLLQLKNTCKFFRQLIPDCSFESKQFWLLNEEEIGNFQKSKKMNWNRQLGLLLTLKRGCECCGKKKIRKIFWEYSFRVCDECKKQLTISHYQIQLLGLPINFLKSIPFVSCDLWNRQYGSYSLDFYSKSEICPILKKYFNLEHLSNDFEVLSKTINNIQFAISVERNRLKKIEDVKKKQYEKESKLALKRKITKDWENLGKDVKIERRKIEMIDYCKEVIPQETLLNLRQFKKFMSGKPTLKCNKRGWLVKFLEEINK